jgi:hypothetical protein
VITSLKDKPLSVFLLKGFISDNQVRAQPCEKCKAISEVITVNHSNPNLLLYGCKDTKCKHKILRLNFDEADLTYPIVDKKNSSLDYKDLAPPLKCAYKFAT